MNNIMVTRGSWQDVETFWRENQHLKTDITPTNIDNRQFWFKKNILDYEKDKVIIATLFPFDNGDELVGCVRVESKHCGHLRIAALGKMAVDQKYRRNMIADNLMVAACLYMNQGIFNISILWASILHLYEKYGYVAIQKNMMVKYFNTCRADVNMLRRIPEKLGTW